MEKFWIQHWSIESTFETDNNCLNASLVHIRRKGETWNLRLQWIMWCTHSLAKRVPGFLSIQFVVTLWQLLTCSVNICTLLCTEIQHSHPSWRAAQTESVHEILSFERAAQHVWWAHNNRGATRKGGFAATNAREKVRWWRFGNRVFLYSPHYFICWRKQY